jgi:hypothetical protein
VTRRPGWSCTLQPGFGVQVQIHGGVPAAGYGESSARAAARGAGGSVLAPRAARAPGLRPRCARLLPALGAQCRRRIESSGVGVARGRGARPPGVPETAAVRALMRVRAVRPRRLRAVGPGLPRGFACAVLGGAAAAWGRGGGAVCRRQRGLGDGAARPAPPSGAGALPGGRLRSGWPRWPTGGGRCKEGGLVWGPNEAFRGFGRRGIAAPGAFVEVVGGAVQCRGGGRGLAVCTHCRAGCTRTRKRFKNEDRLRAPEGGWVRAQSHAARRARRRRRAPAARGRPMRRPRRRRRRRRLPRAAAGAAPHLRWRLHHSLILRLGVP